MGIANFCFLMLGIAFFIISRLFYKDSLKLTENWALKTYSIESMEEEKGQDDLIFIIYFLQ